MNRELKFRAWTVLEGRKEFIYFPIYRIGEFDWGIFDAEPIFQQFTGLKDKDGKEIYEGDIIEVKGWQNSFKASVIHSHKDVGFKIKDKEGVQYLNFPAIQYIEVIGNIFNEELDKLRPNNYDRLMSKIS